MKSLLKFQARGDDAQLIFRARRRLWLFVIPLVAFVPGSIIAEGPITAVQDSLKREQFFFGAPNGVLDDATRAALRRFQIRRGLPVTGEIDIATLQALESPADSTPATVPAEPPTSREPAPPKEIVEGDREFLQKIEGVREPQQLPAPDAPLRSVAPPPPASLIPPDPGDVTSPVVPAKVAAVRRKAIAPKVVAVEMRRSGSMGMIEQAFAAETDQEPPRRDVVVGIRRPELRTSPSAADERESDADLTGPSGVKVTRTTTTTTGSDGRTYIHEKKSATYPGTSVPVVRNAAPPNSRSKGGNFFERLFRDDD